MFFLMQDVVMRGGEDLEELNSSGDSSSDTSDSDDSSESEDEDPFPGYPEPDDEDPDDPDEPGDPNEDDVAPAPDGLDDRPYFSLDNPRLNRVLALGRECTLREAVAMVAALSVRYNMEYDVVVKLFRVVNLMLGAAQMPSTKDQLWSILNRKLSVCKRHAYCDSCYRLLGLYDGLGRMVHCCGVIKPIRKVKYFIKLLLSPQLKRFLELPGTWEKLQYRQDRIIRNEGEKSDMFDGSRYRHLSEVEDGLRVPFDFTYNINLDAFEMTKSSNRKATPIFIRLNEAHPSFSKNSVFLAGLWVGENDPNLDLFMETFIVEANNLSTNGLAWTPPGGEEIVSKFFPACCTVDAVDRATIMGHTTHAGAFACTFCNLEGVHINGRKFPLPGTELDLVRRRNHQEYLVHVLVPEPQLRTDASLRQAMEQVIAAQAQGEEVRVEGVLRPSILRNLRFFDLVDSLSTDDLHPIYIGVVAFHMKLILRRLTKYQIEAISQRLEAIKCPTHISRKPRRLARRRKYKGSEWEHILLYFGIPCMQGIVPAETLIHFGLLSSAVYILSRDSISEQGFQTADRLLRLYLIRFQNTYGPGNMRFNLHMLSHLVMVCRKLGPLWCHSTSFFESWNFILGQKVTSPKGSADQIVLRYFLRALIAQIPGDDDTREEVKDEIAFIMTKGTDRGRPSLVHGDCQFYGPAVRRMTTADERRLLGEEGLENVQVLEEFIKMKFNHMEFWSIGYHPEWDIRSDNTYLYTHDNFFCRILAIVAAGDENNRISGMVVERYNVGEHPNGVRHMVHILDRDECLCIQMSEI